ncbi:MAG: alpha-amylase family protein [Candidatus Poribacteria bacterium]
MMIYEIALLTLILSGTDNSDPQSWQGWDEYQVIMWSTVEPKDQSLWFKRLREMECTAEECGSHNDPEPFIRNNFGFYVENLIPELAFLHARRSLYDTDFQGYTTTRDKRFLIRKPSFDDPKFWDEVKPRLQGMIKPYVPHKPLLYDLRDELSIGSFASPMDYCFSPYTLSSFRQWLKKYYSLDSLNKEWDTDFASWDDVEPMTTYEIKDRERKALESGELENYAPWADHREYMDVAFSRALGRLREFIHEIDPNVPVGIEGTQMPNAWGGYDLWKLSQAIDWIEPYDIACSRKIFRSFLPQSAPVLGTVFGDDFNRISRKLWWLLLNGDKGGIIWDDDRSRCIEKDKSDQPITERGKGLKPIFAELKRVAPILFNLQRLDDKIAIHYSQASIRAHWMFDSREDGNTWVRRFSSYEAGHSRLAKVRDSFLRVVEDLGFQCDFVSYEQIENGELIKGEYKALLLPQSVAMSQKECQQIEEFVRQGGLVIADNMTATMDEHCKRLPKGQLDKLFGVNRSSVGWIKNEGIEALPVYESDISLTTGKASNTVNQILTIIENHTGNGRTVYLNIDMLNYGKYRLSPPKGNSYLECFRNILQSSGIQAEVKVLKMDDQPAECVEIWRYQGDDANYVAIMRNAELDVDSLGHAGDHDNTKIEKNEKVQIIFNHKAQLKDIINDKVYGVTDRITMELNPWKPIILELRKP